MPDLTKGCDLFELIAEVETKHQYNAIRFEPATYSKLCLSRSDSQKLLIGKIQKMNGCSWNTALMIYSTSFGAMQAMGFNIYGPACDYQHTVNDFMNDKTAQHTAFEKLIAAMHLTICSPEVLASSSDARHHFAITYNGSPEYAESICAALKTYHYIVKE